MTTLYLAFTLALIAMRAERIPYAPRLVVLNAVLIIVVWSLASRRGRGGVAAVLAEWYPLAFFVILFEEIGSLVHALVDGWRDGLLIEADRAIFGVDLTVWAEAYASYWMTEVMQLAYLSYFPLSVGVAAFLWVRRGRDAFRLLMLASCLTYYTCYVVFILFPIESPYHTLRHLQEVELRGGLFTGTIEWIERYGRVHGGAFPSAHVAGSVVTWLVAWRFAPRLGAWLTPLVALLMASTVYGRYHYGVDVLAGALLGAIGYVGAVAQMGIFSRLFKGVSDPTKDWPTAEGPCPQVNLDRQTLESFGGRIEFGESLDAARFLGRPEIFEPGGEGFCTLTYTRWGIVLEFEHNRFVQVSFLIGEEHRVGEDADFALAEPRGPDDLRLSAGTTKGELLTRFGQPGKLQQLDDEAVLYYSRGPLVSEFQLNEDGRLTSWDVYLD